MPRAINGDRETAYEKMEGGAEGWQKTGVFAPENRKKLGMCAGLTAVVGAVVVAVLVSRGGAGAGPATGIPLTFAGGFFVDPKHFARGHFNGALCKNVCPAQ